MEAQAGRIGEVNVMHLSGELDYADTDWLLDGANVLVERADCLVFDFTHLTYIDSGGVSIIYSLLGRIPRGNGAWVGVLNPSPNVERILDLAGLPEQPDFRVFRSREEVLLANAGLEDTT